MHAAKLRLIFTTDVIQQLMNNVDFGWQILYLQVLINFEIIFIINFLLNKQNLMYEQQNALLLKKPEKPNDVSSCITMKIRETISMKFMTDNSKSRNIFLKKASSLTPTNVNNKLSGLVIDDLSGKICYFESGMVQHCFKPTVKRMSTRESRRISISNQSVNTFLNSNMNDQRHTINTQSIMPQSSLSQRQRVVTENLHAETQIQANSFYNYDILEDVNNNIFKKTMVKNRVGNRFINYQHNDRKKLRYKIVEDKMKTISKIPPSSLVNQYYSPVRLKEESSFFLNMQNSGDKLQDYLINDQNLFYQCEDDLDLIFPHNSKISKRRKSHTLLGNLPNIQNNPISNGQYKQNDTYRDADKFDFKFFLIRTLKLKPMEHPWGNNHIMYHKSYNNEKNLNKKQLTIRESLKSKFIDHIIIIKMKDVLRTLQFLRKYFNQSIDDILQMITLERDMIFMEKIRKTLKYAIMTLQKLQQLFRINNKEMQTFSVNQIKENEGQKQTLIDKLKLFKNQTLWLQWKNIDWIKMYPHQLFQERYNYYKNIFIETKKDFKQIPIRIKPQKFDFDSHKLKEKIRGFKANNNKSPLKQFEVIRERNNQSPSKKNKSDRNLELYLMRQMTPILNRNVKTEFKDLPLAVHQNRPTTPMVSQHTSLQNTKNNKSNSSNQLFDKNVSQNTSHGLLSKHQSNNNNNQKIVNTQSINTKHIKYDQIQNKLNDKNQMNNKESRDISPFKIFNRELKKFIKPINNRNASNKRGFVKIISDKIIKTNK